jgi:NTP pyrophosphatase (non-canonical NTP hydrolase)
MSHFNGLTSSEAERLAVLSEELGEVQQVIGKILRHGYESTNPIKVFQSSNRILLENEIGDLEFAISLLKGKLDISAASVEFWKTEKHSRIWKWLHHNFRVAK